MMISAIWEEVKGVLGKPVGKKSNDQNGNLMRFQDYVNIDSNVQTDEQMIETEMQDLEEEQEDEEQEDEEQEDEEEAEEANVIEPNVCSLADDSFYSIS